jgi:hypothetical protein
LGLVDDSADVNALVVEQIAVLHSVERIFVLLIDHQTSSKPLILKQAWKIVLIWRDFFHLRSIMDIHSQGMTDLNQKEPQKKIARRATNREWYIEINNGTARYIDGTARYKSIDVNGGLFD